ncbi:hypothetical protein BSQ39_05125 [Loigolactobacillus backii]|uniref:hypothetical protein n=1 Tax=Loigolactobacillus backii TaxID=375175 RepID=UPI000C1CBBEA|nr:hypothetical protein [Loigolactobacillus backii]PIO82999.1 hypothetical protein BSQ39_05125 [Loigolactobacillus backii]
MKKLVSLGIITLSTLTLAACGHNDSADKDSASHSESIVKMNSASRAKAKSISSAKKMSRNAKKEATAASKESRKAAAAAQSAAAISSSAQNSQSAAKQQNMMQNNANDSSNNKVNNNSNAASSAYSASSSSTPATQNTNTISSPQQAEAAVVAKVGNGDQSDPITWPYMASGDNKMLTDPNGNSYYWIRGERRSAIEAYQKSGAGSYDGLDYYVYPNGTVVNRDSTGF